ncbi:hypothetical protein D1159_05640 [Pseudoflavonifractor sp. 524-17]|uniref:hypothetical protein n=1 Tax=Pseudoflavonifractor sp. 524-17 TaxID=2304577 RepID=UPI00137A13A7|nr:hypothetical protein [Pseudoflavonifractor sp. 524-17]NCE64080.1 hypothetical protein [Pseudoflavonifractor sp. 524-17]
MNEIQLAERKSTILTKDNNVPNQTIEVLPQERSDPAVPQTPPDGKWMTIRHAIHTVGVCVVAGFIVFGTRGRNLKLSGSLNPLKFTMSISQAVAPTA